MTQAEQTTSPGTRGNSAKKKALVLAVAIGPLAVLVLVCVAIWRGQVNGLHMRATPKGAGAGQTGMSNQYSGLGKTPDQAPAKAPSQAPGKDPGQ